VKWITGFANSQMFYSANQRGCSTMAILAVCLAALAQASPEPNLRGREQRRRPEAETTTTTTTTVPYELVESNKCAGPELWSQNFSTNGNPGQQMLGLGVQGCYEAMMAEPECSKDYFTLGSDNNCGCKKEGAITFQDCEGAKCYKVAVTCQCQYPGRNAWSNGGTYRSYVCSNGSTSYCEYSTECYATEPFDGRNLADGCRASTGIDCRYATC